MSTLPPERTRLHPLQIGFFSIVGIPMYKAMVSAFEDARPLLDGVMANYKCWEAAAASGKDPRT